MTSLIEVVPAVTLPEPPVPEPVLETVSETTPADTLVDTAPGSPHKPTSIETDVTSVDVSEAPASPELATPGPVEEVTPSVPPTEEIKPLVSDIPPPADQTTAEEVLPPVPSPAVEAPPSSESPVQQVNVEPAAGEETSF